MPGFVYGCVDALLPPSATTQASRACSPDGVSGVDLDARVLELLMHVWSQPSSCPRVGRSLLTFHCRAREAAAPVVLWCAKQSQPACNWYTDAKWCYLCRPLVFLATPELASSLLVSALPPSVVLHHLYSRAPVALQSPHARSGFTPAQVMTHNPPNQ